MPRVTKLSTYLQQRGITSKEVAEAMGVKKGYMSNVKNGYQNMTLATLKKLCTHLKCSPNDILDWESWSEKKKKAKTPSVDTEKQ